VLQPFAIEPINPYMVDMKATVQRLAVRGRGILDTAEGAQELEDRLVQAGVDGTEEGRRAWRELLYAAEGLGRFCSAVIVDDEALRQRTGEGRLFTEVLQEQGVIVGVRADTGFFPLNGYGERGTDGIVDLAMRCREYYRCGVRLAKWRCQILCTMEMPTDVAVWENTTRLAQFAQVCQVNGLACAAEVDICMGPGNHSIERTAYISEKVFSQAIRMMNEYDANLEAAILMTHTCSAGPDAGPVMPENAAEYTARTLLRTVPPALAGVHILPGELNPETAARSLRAAQRATTNAPWVLAPVYGPALLAPTLALWAQKGDVATARKPLLRLLEASSQVQLDGIEEAASLMD